MPKIYWFTGQPGSGKTILAKKLVDYLETVSKINVFHVDGNEIRNIWKNYDYTKKGRKNNNKNAQALVEYLHQYGYVVVSLVSPYRKQREDFKYKFKSDLIEFYIHTDEIRGKEEYFAEGYEKPLMNYIDIDTTIDTVDESFQKIITELIKIENNLFN